MAARKPSKQAVETSLPEAPIGTPQSYPGQYDHSFTLQAVMEMRQSIGEMKASIDNMNVTLQGTKSRVDDLVNWKNRILGGAIVIGVICTLIGFGISKFSDYVTISTPVVKSK